MVVVVSAHCFKGQAEFPLEVMPVLRLCCFIHLGRPVVGLAGFVQFC